MHSIHITNIQYQERNARPSESNEYLSAIMFTLHVRSQHAKVVILDYLPDLSRESPRGTQKNGQNFTPQMRQE